jgi:hypothetical protein
MSYASISDLFAFGLRAAAFAVPGRPIAAVDSTADTLTVPMHGATLNDPARVATRSTGGAVPGGLTPGVTYYAIPMGDDLVALADAPDGPAVDLTDAGTGALELILALTPRMQAQLDADSKVIDGALDAYGAPLTGGIPLEVRVVNAQLSAFNLAVTLGLANPKDVAADMAGLTARYEAAMATIGRWRAGQTLPLGVTDSTPDVVESAAAGYSDDPRDWDNAGII